ncbi:hypothetical protein EDC31_103176 [Acidomonas methanolica]|nr:hypothetical protein EDC31_103176 [Acidomonas methanolica]
MFGSIALLCLWADHFTLNDLQSFNGVNKFTRIDNFSLKILANMFFIFSFLSMTVTVIRNNTKYQPLEAILFFMGIFFFLFFAFFSTPLLFFWAHIHHYHLDHFEPAHRGGWYIFKLDGSP